MVQHEQKLTSAEISARLDRLPTSLFIIRITILLALAWIAEAFDIGIIGSSLLPLTEAWNLTPANKAILGVSGTLGIVIALIPAGMLADKLGRKKLLVGGIAWFSIFTVLASFSNNITTLAVMRFIAGFGMGAVFPLPYSYLSEFVPPRIRGTMMGYLNGALTASYLIPPLAASYILQMYAADISWRYLFYIGGIPLILVIPLALWLPESPRWLAKKNLLEAAQNTLEKIEQEVAAQTKKPLPEYTIPANNDSQHQSEEAAWWIAFSPLYIKRTLVVASAYIGAMILWYVMLTFGPILFAEEGFSFVKSLRFNVYLMFAGGIGSVMMGYLADRYGRKTIISLYAVLASIGLVVLGINISSVTIYLAGGLVGLFGLGIFPVTKIYISEQYPTEVRGRGTFSVEAMARFFGGVLATYYVPFIISLTGGSKPIFLITAGALFILTALPIAFLGRETKGLSIDAAANK